MKRPTHEPDTIDIRILAELQPNARLSTTELANRVALTATPCARRIRLLERAGFIDGRHNSLSRMNRLYACRSAVTTRNR